MKFYLRDIFKLIEIPSLDLLSSFCVVHFSSEFGNLGYVASYLSCSTPSHSEDEKEPLKDFGTNAVTKVNPLFTPFQGEKKSVILFAFYRRILQH